MFNEAVSDYLEAVTDLAETTRKTYAMALRIFGEFAAQYGDDPAKYPPEVLTEFRHWMQGRYKPRTIKGYTTAANNLLRWLNGHDRLADDAQYPRTIKRLEADRTRAHNGGYVARPIDPAVMRLLSHYVNAPLPTQKGKRLMLLRNRALVAFLYDTAARIAEVLALTRAEVIDGRADRVILYKTKGNKPRTVFISEDTRRLLQEYIAARDDHSDAALFVSHARGKGKAITTHQAWAIIKDAAREEGLLDSTSPHCLRHARAQDLLDAGMPLEWITTLLGHESPGTTKNVYAPHVDANRLGALMAQYGKSPLERAKEE